MLLQTEEYTLGANKEDVMPPGVSEIPDIEAILRERRHLLHNSNRQFRHVITETALRWPYLAPALLAEQMRHLAAASQFEGVTVQVVPLRGRVINQGPMSTFAVYDQRLVLVEISGGELALTDPRDIAYHLELFAYFESCALDEEQSRELLLNLADEFDARAARE
jgi:hypothetical protein